MKKIIYTTNHEETAEGYATCFGDKSGWVKKYKIKKNLTLPDISDQSLHYDSREVKKLFCDQNKKGYYLKWGDGIEEIAICDPEEYLEYIGSKRCFGKGKFGPYSC